MKFRKCHNLWSYRSKKRRLHTICPGDTRMELTSPIFDEVNIEVGPSKHFKIMVKKESPKSVYIQSAKLNGKVYNHCYLDYADIMKGGTLELTLGDEPNKKWGVE